MAKDIETVKRGLSDCSDKWLAVSIDWYEMIVDSIVDGINMHKDYFTGVALTRLSNGLGCELTQPLITNVRDDGYNLRVTIIFQVGLGYPVFKVCIYDSYGELLLKVEVGDSCKKVYLSDKGFSNTDKDIIQNFVDYIKEIEHTQIVYNESKRDSLDYEAVSVYSSIVDLLSRGLDDLDQFVDADNKCIFYSYPYAIYVCKDSHNILVKLVYTPLREAKIISYIEPDGAVGVSLAKPRLFITRECIDQLDMFEFKLRDALQYGLFVFLIDSCAKTV